MNIDSLRVPVVRRDKLRGIAGILALCLLLPLSAAGNASTEASEPNLEVGNYWTYLSYMGAEDMVINGTVTMEIVDVREELVDGETQDVFVLDSTGLLEISGSSSGYDVSGSGTVKGTDIRLCSNFDLVRSASSILMEYTVYFDYYMNITVTMEMGYQVEYTPALNDYVGDEEILQNDEFNDTANIQGEAWVNYLDENTTEPVDGEFDYNMTVFDDDVDKNTDAGTFECSRIDVTISGVFSGSGTSYYSAEVGNYVEMSEDSAYYLGMLGELELVDYSYNPDGVPPVADAGDDFTVKVGEEFEFNGTRSSDNFAVTNYTWKLVVDGETTYLYGAQPEHAFDSKGTYTVNLTVKDDGGNSDSDSVVVTVKDEGVLAYFIGDQMWIGLTLIAVLVVAVVASAMLMRRRRRGGPATVPPPAQATTQPPVQEQPPPPGNP